MNIMILAAASFIGTNLTVKLAKNKNDRITVVDKNVDYFSAINEYNFSNVDIKISSLDENTNFEILKNQDVVYHLVSSNVPTTSNKHISQDIRINLAFSLDLLEACVRYGVKKVVFISSGGTVYGKVVNCPLNEKSPTYPISSYGLQKITIEKLLYLYNYIYGLDYRIIRLANPYGPYQRPNGVIGAVTTFTYKAIKGEKIEVFGDGSVVRDFIYIDDAVKAIIKIANASSEYKTFNLGCGYGTSIRELLKKIETTLNVEINVVYEKGRSVDVPINYLDISRYERCFGELNPISLEDGIMKTAEFLRRNIL